MKGGILVLELAANGFVGYNAFTKACFGTVKNANGKLVCRVEGLSQTVEIVHKKHKTLIQFLPDGIQITNVEI